MRSPLTLPSLLLATLLSIGASAELPADAVWIDVRSPGEYAEGHLEQAHSIPFDGIEAGVSSLAVDKDTPIYLYCAVGGRAEIAKQRLEARDYSNVTNVGSLENARKLATAPAP